ncbi:hypothetical protein J7J90_03430 [Candidatus Micrarchaeota archaeon]|nr:hypothetical protein [Candidatus Micrarchaeota archaeon]
MKSLGLKRSSNIKPIIMFMLIVTSVSFASFWDLFFFPINNWMLVSTIAVLLSGVLLALTYMVAQLMNNPYMTAAVKNELVQWAITSFIVMAFVIILPSLLMIVASGSLSFGQEYTPPTGLSGEEVGPSGVLVTYVQYAAVNIINQTTDNLKKLANSLDRRIQEVSEQSAMTGICNFWQVGFSMSFCGALGALQGPLTNGFNVVNMGIAELEMLKVLVVMGGNIGLLILFPAGIILRTFSMTRKTGGILIALGLALGIILPLSVIFLRFTVDQYYAHYGGTRMYHVPYFYEHDDDTCDEFSTNYDKHMKVPIYRYTDEGFLLNVAEPFILESVIITLGSLFFTLTFITSMGALFGMPVDVSGLVRLVQ